MTPEVDLYELVEFINVRTGMSRRDILHCVGHLVDQGELNLVPRTGQDPAVIPTARFRRAVEAGRLPSRPAKGGA